ncbi:hypothetical protein AGDE_12792 [Angomonas deanei]|nr:hypothetical protein AGDE_12792 [Angomonas deanei]|eukprot:EPY23579.1 hypothetical protein AGDE_12792 [Angomonas deanei]
MTEVLSRNDSRIGHFYRKVMEQELEDGLEADDPIVTTKCPISQATMQVPVRGTNCGHLQCFDMSAFLLGGSRSYYWNCPLCDEPVDLMVDTILWRYLVRERNATYLRLHKEGSAYTWQSSRRGGGMTDLQVDDSFDEEAGEEDEGKNSLTTETEVVRGGDLHLKRPREEEGSADCPIEL